MLPTQDGSSHAPEAEALAQTGALALASFETSSVAKILQSEGCVVMAFKVDGKLCIVRGRRLIWLQDADTMNSETIRAMLQAQHTSVDLSRFLRRIRNACSDRLSANLTGEQGISKMRHLDWSSFHSFCHCHMGATCMCLATKSDLVEDGIKGCKAYCRAAASPGEMDKIRCAAQRVLFKKVRVVQFVDLDAEARKFKELVFRAISEAASEADMHSVLLLKAALTMYAPGDWRNARDIYVLAPVGTSTFAAVNRLVKEFLPHVFGRVPWNFPDGKWTGAEKTWRDVGAPLCVHGLLRDTFIDYMQHDHPKELTRGRGVDREIGVP